MEPDVLIAYQMNGQDLTPDHGYPLRAIVPGHYGMASVKWLDRHHCGHPSFRATGRLPTTAIGMIPREHLSAGRYAGDRN